MFEQSETLQELWRIKREIAAEYASLRDFCAALIERQAKPEAKPEAKPKETRRPALAH